MPARVDRASAPEVRSALLLARRGQSFWARALSEVRDEALREPARTPGRTRAHVVAEVALEARGLADLLEALPEARWTRDPAADAEAADFAATLPPEALRNLAAHAAVHLSVAWRDLPDETWRTDVVVVDAAGAPVADPLPVIETVRAHTRTLWTRALDLGVGYTASDLPPAVLALLDAAPPAALAGSASSPTLQEDR